MVATIANNMYGRTVERDFVKKKSMAKTKSKNEVFFSSKLTEEQAKETYLSAREKYSHIFSSPSTGVESITLCWFPVYDVTGNASGTYFKKTAWVAREFSGSSGSTDYYTNYYRDVYSSANESKGRVCAHYLIKELLSTASEPFMPESNITIYDDPDALDSELSMAEFSAEASARAAAERDIKSQYSFREQYHMTDKQKKAVEKKANAAKASIGASSEVNSIQYHPFYIVCDNGYNSLVNAISGEVRLEGDLGLNQKKINAASRREKLIKVLFFLLNLGVFAAIGWFFMGRLWLERLTTDFARMFKADHEGSLFAFFLTVMKAVLYLIALIGTILWFRFHDPDLDVHGQVNRHLKKLKKPSLSLLRPFVRMLVIFLIMEGIIAAIFAVIYYFVIVPDLTYVPTNWWWNLVPIFGFLFIGGAIYGTIKGLFEL